MKILDVPQSGSVAGVVSSRNRFGQYRRTRSIPVNPNTDRQSLVRGRLSDASIAWRGLSGATRDAWATYAGENPRQDSLGQTIYLSGFQWFVSQFLALSNAGLATPPDVPSTPAAAAIDITSLVASVELGVLTDMVFETAAVVGSGVVLTVEASPFMSAGVSFNADYRFLQNFSVALVGGTVNVTAAYIAKFGTPPIGSRVFVRAYLQDATSRPGAVTLASVVVAAA